MTDEPTEFAPLSDLIDAAIEYLRDVGIMPTVIGGIQVEHDPNDGTHNHRLVIGFTAKLPNYLPDHAPEVIER